MRNKILCTLLITILILGCHARRSEIKVLGEKTQKDDIKGYVVNGGPGSTEAIYQDAKGDTQSTTSNVVKIPIKEKCEEEVPVVEEKELTPIEEPEEKPLPVERTYGVELKSITNHIVASSKQFPEVFFRTDAFVPKKPPKIVLKKYSDEDVLCCDRQLTFRIRFTNTGGDDAYNINVSDVVPANVEYLEETAGAEPYLASIKYERGGKDKKVKKIYWTVEGPIAPGEEGEVFYSVICPQVRPKLSCYIRFAPKALNIGQEGTVTANVVNSGTGPAEDVKLVVLIPAGIEYQGYSRGRKLTFDCGKVEVGETISQSFKITMRSGGKLDSITANISSKGGEGCECTVPPAPTLSIDKTGPVQVVNRLPMEYTIVVRNTSDRKAPATNCILTDKLPEFCTFKTASNDGKYDKSTNSVVWDLGTLQPGDMVSRTIVLIPQRSGVFTDQAEVKCDEGIIVTDDAVTQVRGITAMNITSYDTEDPVGVGETTTYIIEIWNSGFKKSTELVLTNTIPRLTELVSAKGEDPQGREIKHSIQGDKIVFDAIPILESGEKATYKVTVKVTGKAELKNIAELKYKEFGKVIIVEEPTNVYD